MIDTAVRSDVQEALDALTAAVDRLLDVDLGRAGREDLLDLARGLERQSRRLPAAWHRLIAQLDERGVAGELATRDTATLLARLLRIDPAEARGRCASASELGPRRAVTGEPLEPLFPAVAAAQAAGDLSAAHARVITAGIAALPAEDEFTHGRALERTLVEKSREHDPHTVGQQVTKVLERLDPDGPEPRERDQQRRREVNLRRNTDGSAELKGHLTPIAAAAWSTILDALSAPVPADETGEPDDRSPSQRRHDALLDAGQRLLRSGDLPDASGGPPASEGVAGGGGTPVTILLRMSAEDLRSGRGYADTEHGDLVAVREVIRHAGDGAVTPVLFDATGGIMSYGRARRLACPAQRRALAARDGGCSFPGCTAPASWCQVHHVRPWALGGRTDIAAMALLCGYHHREFERRGWECVMIGGVPHWRPPAWIAPDRKPRRNTAHHSELWFAPPATPPPREPASN